MTDIDLAALRDEAWGYVQGQTAYPGMKPTAHMTILSLIDEIERLREEKDDLVSIGKINANYQEELRAAVVVRLLALTVAGDDLMDWVGVLKTRAVDSESRENINASIDAWQKAKDEQ